jgi:hypothetical protein
MQYKSSQTSTGDELKANKQGGQVKYVTLEMKSTGTKLAETKGVFKQFLNIFSKFVTGTSQCLMLD